MPGLPDTLDDRLNHLGKLMHEQDDEQMARIQRLEERQGFLLSAVAQLQRYLPKDIMPVPICDVGEGISDAQAIAALLNAADVAGQIEQGKGTGTYTGDLND